MAVVSVPTVGLLASHAPRIPHEFPLLPVADGALHPVGNVVVLAMPDELPVWEPYVPCVVVVTSLAWEDALNGPLLVDVLAV